MFLQEINRKLSSTVLTPPGRTASQTLLVSLFLSRHRVAVKLIGINVLHPLVYSRLLYFMLLSVTTTLANWQRSVQ